MGKRFKRVECGYYHSVAISHDKVIYSWGRNTFGQLGQGDNPEEIDNNVPRPVRGILHMVKIQKVSCGW